MNTPAPTPPGPGRVLVTGATGLLGSNITAQLLAAGAEVTALARSADRARRLLPAHRRLRVIEGDITRVDRFAGQLRGVGAIVQTAAYFREYYQPGGNDPALLQRVNVDAVERLLEAAADAEVPVIVPAWMWGPGDAAPTASGRFFLAVARGELSAIPRAGSQIVDARDVAAAAIRAITRGAHARRYIVGGSRQPLPATAGQIAAAVGAPAPRQVPAAMAMAGATVIELTARLRHRDPPVTRAGTRVLLEGDRQHLSSQRAEHELDVTFRPLAQTITDEAAWYRSHGMLPSRHAQTPGTERAEASAGPSQPGR